ncbi:NUDIX domain-containing protein [Paenibacillus polymyxa]|uniref:NUDIX domain-containing protein n=1 Tax=Paenibacillus polymyxa TaxID=1406 RepID=UPI0025B72C31|nr:NUDIX domain-containing protein [Paenibacillus polymyxa]MDN4079941.1 NUDIX domain-containing protein [Paenibacillus polymyxa]MDN4105436.1 NUDIX domain-containing protein [Paenibacillus polymyxa]MDN4115830.1 NUDIX domain-containing protein [Paenibacillus polymyxa]MEB4780607.1 NUDIX domain-containing protein [Paenibacillus jamilae]
MIQKLIHPDTRGLNGRIYERKAARGIIMRGSEILLLYTRRYNDYSFPGGGVEANEDLLSGLIREITEETGAIQVEVTSEFGYIEEYRPHYNPEYDLIHMLSYYYVCSIHEQLGEARLEDYEMNNGMSAVWIDIHQAIMHNRQVIKNKEASMGLSIERETIVLELIASELIF